MPDVLHFVRRDADSGGKLSKSTIIVIAVLCSCVVVLVFALFAWRLLARSFRRSKKVPLPPVQDLAHHREQQLAAFSDRNARPTTWLDSAGPSIHQPHPRLYSSHFLSASASSASLIRHGSSPDVASTVSRGPTRENSWTGEDATSAESSPYPTPLSTEELMPPNPSFLPVVGANPHTSMTSVASSSSDAISDANAAMPASPSEQNHSAESSASLANSPYGSPARARPPRASRSRSRPMSMVSSHTSHSLQTSHSVNTLRGPAHSIHSNIQIVLPAPLAPELYPQPQPHPLADAGGFERTSSFYGGGDRRSAADPWLFAGSRPQSMARIDREASSGSPMSSVGPRSSPGGSRPRSSLHKVSASATSLHDGDSASAKARRAQSQPPIPSAPSAPAVSRARTPSPGPSRPSSAFAQPASPLPPVPRIPSQYGRAGGFDDRANGYPQADAGEEPARGRARDPNPLPVGAAAPVPMVGAPAPPSSYAGPRRETSGKLRKNRSQDRRTRL
ncbi:hypothetical protein L227DRAFT_572982 [Lentinus tigrinus ALCF2SS1-6]|uniref:Uncharacterized protein n=1 Tax=Lentinus tigrinus ALCF2SS1-6 TaxID=1328759 RepID=A0A5C2SHC3_9APHY|nr:hypothetical protein L227DRAFT_572982 [Lentinus tigrinus ALCF2SS1-6]